MKARDITFKRMPEHGFDLGSAYNGPYVAVRQGVGKSRDTAIVYLPVVLGSGDDDGHNCHRCESPVAWGRRWCHILNLPINAHACDRVRAKSPSDAAAWFWERFLRRHRQRDQQGAGAVRQGHKRAVAGVLDAMRERARQHTGERRTRSRSGATTLVAVPQVGRTPSTV